MTEEGIKRINVLYKKSQSEGLTEAEKVEQAQLRREYIESYKRSLTSQLDNTYIQYPDGKKKKLGMK